MVDFGLENSEAMSIHPAPKKKKKQSNMHHVTTSLKFTNNKTKLPSHQKTNKQTKLPTHISVYVRLCGSSNKNTRNTAIVHTS